MKTKVFELKDRMHLIGILDTSGKFNVYRLYLVYPGRDKYGYMTEHRKQLAAYGDMQSVVWHITDMYKAGIHYKPYDVIIAWNKQYYRPV